MNAVDRHPQRREIIEAIVGGKSLRTLAAKIAPPLHYATLARYRVRILGTATASLRGTNANSRALKDLAAVSGVGKHQEQRLDGIKNQVRLELDEAVLTQAKRFEKWLSDAESSQSVDDDTGEVRHNMDHAALARHARNALSAIELRAKLNGVLQDAAGSTQVNVNAVVVMPSHAPESRDDGPVIDIDVVR